MLWITIGIPTKEKPMRNRNMKKLALLILAFIASCQTVRKGAEPKEFLETKKFYEKKLLTDAKFLMNCDNLKTEPHEEYVFYSEGFMGGMRKVSTLTEVDAARIPLSFKVSGCNKRVIMLLVQPDRKSICDSNHYYKLQTCVFIQDSSFTTEKK